MNTRIGEALGLGPVGMVASLLAALAVGCAAFLAGSGGAAALAHHGLRALAVGLFLLLAFFGSSLFVLVGLLNPLLSTDRWRLFRFLSAVCVYLGFFGGAAWALWLHGDPARIVSW